MGRKCCVPGCKSNYATTYIPVFTFPRDEQRRALWIRSINRAEFIPSLTAVVCIKHFSSQHIIKEDKIKREDGSILVVPRKKITLTLDAYPTIFSNQPTYLSKELPPKRKSPSERSQELSTRDEENFADWCIKDNITSFEDFKSKYNTKSNAWLTLDCDNFILFYKICESECPKLVTSFKIFNDLKTKVWHCDNEIDSKSLEWILGHEHKCDKWTKFECLSSHLASYKDNGLSFDQKLAAGLKLMKECHKDIENENCMDPKNFNFKLSFLTEQIELLCTKKLRYSPDLILWASKLFFCYPAAYVLIRNGGQLIMPHPSYLKKLSSSLKCSSTGDDSSHLIYLKKKAELLNDHEKIVNVLLDEIYVNPLLSYKGGDLVGSSTNSNTEATTIQTFMIASLLSKNKDVVALIPVKNLTAQNLYTYTVSVLKILHNCGYTVLSLISDNNRINRNMFNMMCEGELKQYIKHPTDETKRLYFLFDTVHLMKAVRNNWLNQTNTDQSIYYPDPADFTEVCSASVLHLQKIYESERTSIAKQAPKLSQKVLFPTSTEKQNVIHALNLFHETNITALKINCKQFGEELKGTKIFIEHFHHWWNIVNVKHPHKGTLQRNKFSRPINNISDDNIVFLKCFSAWLNAWENISKLSKKEKLELGIPAKGGMLSKETHFALKFTTDGLVDIIQHLFQSFGLSYVLLGKFQTDSLEARFGQYRQMCGGNYNISCRQVLESERKLKILSLISLYSEKAGKFEVKSLDFSDDDNYSMEYDVPANFYDVFNSYNDENIEDSTLSILIYIAGYVAHKIHQNGCCRECFLILASDSNLEYEVCNEEILQYMQLSNRGGLKRPNIFTIQVVVHTYFIFQRLISKKHEEAFLRHGKQKHLIVQLVIEKLELIGILSSEKCNNCKVENAILGKKCICIVANIFLNNYTKVRNDKTKSNSKRKLLTLIQ